MTKRTSKSVAKKPKPNKAGKERAFIYDLWARDHIRHVDGEMYDKPFVLEDWQYKNIWEPIFGTLNNKLLRYFDLALIMLPRTGGKSEIAARIILTLAEMEPVFKGEYGFGAGTKPQARIVQDKVASMIRQDPELSSHWEVLKDCFRHKNTGSTFTVYPNDWKELQGHHFDGFVLDEAHVLKDRKVFDAIYAGQVSKPNSLFVIISTATPTRNCYLYQELIPDLKKNSHAYIYWLGVSEQDCKGNKPKLKSTWKKVCVPSWFSIEAIQKQYETQSLQNFIAFTLNQFPPDDITITSAFKPSDIKAIPIDEKCELWSWERQMVLGIDGAVGASDTSDTFALIYSQWLEDGRRAIYPFIYQYEQGQIGHNLDQIEDLIKERWEHGYVRETVIDPARLLLMASHLEHKYGLPITSMAQSPANMCAAAANLLGLIRDGQLVVCGKHAAGFVAQLKNCVRLEREPYGWRIGKEKSNGGKIDGPIAASMSLLRLSEVIERGPAQSYEVEWI